MYPSEADLQLRGKRPVLLKLVEDATRTQRKCMGICFYRKNKRKHKPFESISQVSGKEVAIRAIAAHEESKRRSKSVQSKATLLGS